MQSGGKRILATFALAVLSLCFAFAVPEILLRLTGPAFLQNVFGEAGDHLRGIGDLVAATERYQAERGIEQPPNFLKPSDLLWSLVPGYDETIIRLPAVDREQPAYRVKVNALGFRGEAPKERRGVFRVLCLGDSVTFGDKLDEAQTYPAILGALLAERWPDRDVEVLNAGVPGYSSHQGVALWRKLRQYTPSVVVVGLGINDTWPSRVRDSESLAVDGSFLDHARSGLRRTRLYQAMRAVILRLKASPENERVGASVPLGQRVPPQETDRNIRRIAREAREQGALPIVVNFLFGNAQMGATLRTAAAKAGVPFLDMPETFRREREAREAQLARALGLAGRCPDAGGAAQGFVFRVRLRDRQRTGGEVVALVQGAAGMENGFITLNDSGEGCDEGAGDGVYSGLIAAESARPINFKFGQRKPDGAIEDEFHGFPLSWRAAIAAAAPGGGPLMGPIEDYNEFYLMSEEIHPNADGARLIAESLADLIQRADPEASRRRET